MRNLKTLDNDDLLQIYTELVEYYHYSNHQDMPPYQYKIKNVEKEILKRMKDRNEF